MNSVVRVSGRINVDSHLFGILEDGFIEGFNPASLRLNSLIIPISRGALLQSGMEAGPVDCQLELWPSSPDAPTAAHLALWDDIVEVSVESSVGRLVLEELGGLRPSIFPVVSFTGAGRYRVRASVRGRDSGVDQILPDPDADDDVQAAFVPVESYLLQVWRSDVSGVTVYQQRDSYGAGLRLTA